MENDRPLLTHPHTHPPTHARALKKGYAARRRKRRRRSKQPCRLHKEWVRIIFIIHPRAKARTYAYRYAHRERKAQRTDTMLGALKLAVVVVVVVVNAVYEVKSPLSTKAKSALTISVTRDSKRILGFQPKCSAALAGSPSSKSTSVGRK